ncbi:cell wall-binding repeat-containing protein [Microbacterium jejuense]|uniref:Cell wall-binding repeat-containing protein n=1 Tax=Microbacterium jejuense TaxID=1263637 RepID=A0ABS7HNU2_9MICO|nr:cell wall-binding repeat-containing protein [Microbacterium jejuense]
MTQELARLRPAKIIILGSDASITDNVLTQAGAYADTVERTAGVDRYATSAAVSAATFEPGTPVAYLANGEKFPDALSGAAAAGHLGGPVLLTQQDSIPGQVTQELARLRPAKIIILGSDASITDNVLTQAGAIN